MRRRQSLSKCAVVCAFIITHLKILADTFGTIVRHQFYPTCDFLQIFHSKVQLAIQGLPFEFPGAPTCAEIRSEYECAVGTAL